MNTQRPTPRTDAHQDDMNRVEFDEELALTYQFARDLERENEAMRAAIEEAEKALRIARKWVISYQCRTLVWQDEQIFADHLANAALAALKPFLPETPTE